MFKEFINQEIIVYLKSEEKEKYHSSTSIECVLLDYDTKFLKLLLKNKEIHCFNVDFVRDITLSKK